MWVLIVVGIYILLGCDKKKTILFKLYIAKVIWVIYARDVVGWWCTLKYEFKI